MAEVRNDGKNENQLGVGDQPHAEKGRSTHAALGVVQEAIDAGVGELRGNLLDEEKVGVEPAKVAQYFVARGSGPYVQRDE